MQLNYDGSRCLLASRLNVSMKYAHKFISNILAKICYIQLQNILNLNMGSLTKHSCYTDITSFPIFLPGFGCALFCTWYYMIAVYFMNHTSFDKGFRLNESTKILLYQTYTCNKVFNMLCILFQVKPATRMKQRKIAPNPTPSPNNTYLAQLLTTGEYW